MQNVPKVPREVPDQTCETKLLQIIFYYFDFYPLFHVISAIIHKFPPWFSASPSWFPIFFCISTQIPEIPTLIPRTGIPIPFLIFPPLFSGFLSFFSPNFLFWFL